MKKKFRNLSFYILSLIIPSIILGITFYIKKITPFGTGSLITGDMEWQFVPFVNELCEKIKSGNSLMYSWFRGMGHDFIGEIAYYLASPLNLIFLFFNTKTLPTAVTLLVTLKSSLCGLTMFTYLNMHFRKSCNNVTNKVIMVSFSCCYALSSYLLSYYMLIMWFDCMYMLPLIILSLESLINNKKPYLYSICLGYAIFTNYYIGYMVCFFVVLYFIYYMYNEYNYYSENSLLHVSLRFITYSILGGGLAAIIWLPEIYTLTDTISGAASSFGSVLTSIFDTLGAYYGALASTSSAYFCDSKVYCGIIVLILVPLYFFNHNISAKKRCTTLLFIAFIYLSLSVKPLEYIWNGFHQPIGYVGRNTFLLVFLLITISYENIANKDVTSAKLYIYLCIFNIFYCISGFGLFKSSNILNILAFNMIFIILYAFIIFLYKPPYKFIPTFLTALLIIVELCFNCYNTIPSYTSIDTYNSYIADTASLIHQIKPDKYFRIKNDCKQFKNISSLCLYNSIPTVSSTANDNINHMLSRLGQFSSLNAINDLGWEPVSASMLGIKYLILTSEDYDSDILSYKNISRKNSEYVYENNYCLTPAFAVDSNIGNIKLEDYDTPFDIINALCDMYNINAIYEKTNLTVSDHTVTIPPNADIYLYCKKELTDSSLEYNNTSSIVYPTFLIDITVRSDLYNDNYIYHLPILKTGGQITINTDYDVSDIPAYILNKDSFMELMELMSKSQIQINDYNNTSISGNINAEENSLIFTSIPYSRGWSVLVDGKKVKTSTCFDALLSFSISKGTHKIEFQYMTPGLLTGCIISLTSLILILYISFSRKKRGLSL